MSAVDDLRLKASRMIRGRRLIEGPTRPQDRHLGKYRAWAVGLDTAWGDTQEAALRSLIERLELLTPPSSRTQEGP